jgi:hypothetical protein
MYQRGMPPDAVYSFRHALVRDAAYGSLLRGSRRELHALIAQALQAQSGELMETQPELFAWHYAEAGLVEKSVGFWAKAGQRSAAPPRLSRVIVLANPTNPLNRVNLGYARQAAEKLAVQIEVAEAKSAADVEGALAQIKELRPEAALIGADTQLLSKRKEIANFMAEQRVPAIYPFRDYADVGGLFIYGANLSVLFEYAADYLDRLLKGEKVANLPVQQATAFELIVNLKTASSLGLTIPTTVLARADEVIE